MAQSKTLNAWPRKCVGATYYVGLLFYGLGSTLFCYLWMKSRYIPKALAGFGVLASLSAAGFAFTFILFPGFAKIVKLDWFEAPIGLFELIISFWLLFKGLKPPQAVSAV